MIIVLTDITGTEVSVFTATMAILIVCVVPKMDKYVSNVKLDPIWTLEFVSAVELTVFHATMQRNV